MTKAESIYIVCYLRIRVIKDQEHFYGSWNSNSTQGNYLFPWPDFRGKVSVL